MPISLKDTANITTANWGTARNIQIGNTTKSVNGSGNVTWSLSEIGAAASNHTHNYAASPSAGGSASTVYLPRTGTSESANYLPGANRFVFKEFANQCTNMPNANWYHILTGQGSDANYNTQLALGMTTQAVYYRNRSEGTWRDWKQLAFTDSSISGNASTATTLQTARTINGTSFNGSGNITTANWGTARNIQIGNTAKSVNGSGNVSWSLSEIGAAAASHTHGYAPTATGSSISIHADSDSSSTSEYLLLKAGHNELKIASSAGGTTVTKGQDKLTFNGNIVYHAGRKPTVSEIGAAPTSHNHTSLTGVTNIAFAAATSDSASMGMAVSDDKTYFDFNLSDDANADMWRWRFGAWDSSTSSTKTFNAMTLTATSATAAKLTVSGTVQASTFSGALSGNATTATKLQTARSINGTNFDGSANITTANWGTARNIQIGNTSKSVNGSGNVSWSLSEIGAAPAGYGLGTTCQDKSNQDCNNILVTGFYMGSNMTNKPSGCTHGWIYLLVMKHNDSWVRQVAYDFGTASQVYTRVKQNGSWSSWVATDTNTWRGVQDNLTSTATDQSLSANQGKVLKGLIDGKAASNHSHSYLPLSGGTMTGTLELKLGGSTLTGTGINTGNKQLIGTSADTIYFGNPKTKMVLESISTPTVAVNGKNYAMYHTGNKPTPSDIGAAASSSVGTLSSLKTSAKGNLVDAINEVFQSADSARSSLVSAIGSPLTSTDTLASIATKLQSKKQELGTAAAKVVNGVSSSTNLNTIVSTLNGYKPYVGRAHTLYVDFNGGKTVYIEPQKTNGSTTMKQGSTWMAMIKDVGANRDYCVCTNSSYGFPSKTKDANNAVTFQIDSSGEVSISCSLYTSKTYKIMLSSINATYSEIDETESSSYYYVVKTLEEKDEEEGRKDEESNC